MTPIETGNPASPLWIVGEAPGADEIAEGRPFVGASGQLLTRLLAEAGFDRSRMFITNVVHERPPGNEISEWFGNKSSRLPELDGKYPDPRIIEGRQHLLAQATRYQPQQILAFGNTALWALTGEWGIGKWRGSILPATCGAKLIPTVHPAAILREWAWRNIVLQDLRRAKRESLFPEIRRPKWDFLIRPVLPQVLEWCRGMIELLEDGPRTLACDIETWAGQISCIGIAWSKNHAICIPLTSTRELEGYWTGDEEHAIILALRSVLTHRNSRIVFQNGAYDLQYFAHQYGFLPRICDDTMLMQHVAFPGLRKGLDFLSSLYCQYHRYWKDDGKLWDPSLPEEQHWTYNCEDCVRTYEVWEVLSNVLQSLGLEAQYQFQIRELFPIVLRMMLRGVRFDASRRASIRAELEDFIRRGNEWLTVALGHPLNVESNHQMKRLIYDDLRIPVILNRKTRNPTLDDEALDSIQRRYPLLRPLLSLVSDLRSANTALSSVLSARIPNDNRVRCTYNLAGTETFRFASSEDAFGRGFNLQNLTKGDEE